MIESIRHSGVPDRRPAHLFLSPDHDPLVPAGLRPVGARGWRKTKTDLVEEMSTALQMPGWGNSFTQPIANRVEMLSTGVRLPVAVKVFGSNLEAIQRVSQEIAAVVRGVRGAADVFADQIVGKEYVEIKIDRKKAARYGINVGDIQDVVEVALGGKALTRTVEGRERYPVRARYARDYRDGVDEIKNILVSARGKSADAAQAAGMGGMSAPTPSSSAGAPNQLLQIPLAELAAIRAVEGPSMIKSENGLLRSYIQLRVRGRDEVGFVEELMKSRSRTGGDFPPILVRFLSRSDRSGPPDCSNPLDRSDTPADKPGRSRQKMAKNGAFSRAKSAIFPCLEQGF